MITILATTTRAVGRASSRLLLACVAIAVVLASLSVGVGAAATGEEPVDPSPTTTTPEPTDVAPGEGGAPDDPALDEPVEGEPAPDEPDPEGPAPEAPDEPVIEEPVIGLPATTPPGFTDEQYRRFVDLVRACGFDAGRVCETVLGWTGSETLAESAQWIVDVPLRLALIVLAAVLANRAVRALIERITNRSRSRRAAEADDLAEITRDALRVTTASRALGNAATVAIAAITGLILLGELGISLGPLLAGAGIAGIALGFGAQHVVRDVLAGLFIVFEDHYGVGDIIDAGRASGVVEDVNLRITRLRDVHGTLWVVPNGSIAEVGNLTQLWARAIIDFDVAYRVDHERAGEIIKQTADELWRDPDAEVQILEEPELWGVEDLGDSSVVIRLAVKCAPAQQWKLARVLRGRVKSAFDAAGIEIPFPQQTIWIQGNDARSPDEAVR